MTLIVKQQHCSRQRLHSVIQFHGTITKAEQVTGRQLVGILRHYSDQISLITNAHNHKHDN